MTLDHVPTPYPPLAEETPDSDGSPAEQPNPDVAPTAPADLESNAEEADWPQAGFGSFP